MSNFDRGNTYHQHFRAIEARDPLNHVGHTGNRLHPEAYA